MRELCVLCHKVHSDTDWKYTLYTTSKGTQYGYFCRKWFTPTKVDWVPQRIKNERVQFKKEIVQPWREGEPSQEYAETYPDKAKKIFKNEKKKPSRVWKDIAGW